MRGQVAGYMLQGTGCKLHGQPEACNLQLVPCNLQLPCNM